MTSAVRVLEVLTVGSLLLVAVIGSLWLAEADLQMARPASRGRFTLPTPTLFPTISPRRPVVARPTQTPATSPPTTSVDQGEPSPTPGQVCVVPEGWVYYTVQLGDTFYSLAERAETNVQELLVGNCKSEAYELQVGEALYVPTLIVTAPTPTPFVCSYPAGWVPVTVGRGESFSSLARRYGVDLSLMLSANCRDRSNTVLYAGSQVYVPYRPAPRPYPTATWVPWPTVIPTRVPPTPIPPTPVPPTRTLPPTPKPTPTPLPTVPPTDTPVPSPTPTPTETPVLVPTWTDVPWPEPSLGPTATAQPTLTATPDGGFAPTPVPTATAGSDPTPVSTTPLAPLETPTGLPLEPTATAVTSTATPLPTPTPAATQAPPTAEAAPATSTAAPTANVTPTPAP